jgi:hypothetical protein
MGVSGQRHDPAALLPPEKGPPVPIIQEAGWAPEPVWTQRIEEKSFRLCRGSNLDRPVVQPVVRHYTAWANQAPSSEPVPVLSDRSMYNVLTKNSAYQNIYFTLRPYIVQNKCHPYNQLPPEDQQRPRGGPTVLGTLLYLLFIRCNVYYTCVFFMCVFVLYLVTLFQ